jgi:hypothetical protein
VVAATPATPAALPIAARVEVDAFVTVRSLSEL